MSQLSKSFVDNIRLIITQAQSKAIRAVNQERVLMYWHIGKHIVEEEQNGKQYADYGAKILQSLANELEKDFGSGFSVRQLELCRQFYNTFPNTNALRSQLNWTQYRLLLRIDNEDKRTYYIEEACNNNWSARQLERQINSQLYERLLLSNDKQKILAIAKKEAHPGTPKEIIKDPMVLEFLGLKTKEAYYEKDLESALISNMQSFLLELGNGFSFVARQKRIQLEDDPYFVDLVFYNRLLRCFVLIEIKTHKLTHQDLGQLQMYVNYFDRTERQKDENPTIGILLCTDKNDTMVEYALPKSNTNILASKYQLYLPKKEELEQEFRKILDNE
ncbi:PDDEXK nuclease domain-containing protein [Owenweeksia hongkongensis]|uniref:PDDEXK nuclease domain-containing protein n=1 Tax=Owenweeksia hongkongensis TaxID=253245 RepID=UPI003A940BA2